jgi:S-methylmethionine-dependent homocysteine/selenocysteine methylase
VVSRDWAEQRAHPRGIQSATTPVVISGCLGPRGDGYNPARLMSAEVAEAYHAEQVRIFAHSAADLVTAITMNYVEEASGSPAPPGPRTCRW